MMNRAQDGRYLGSLLPRFALLAGVLRLSNHWDVAHDRNSQFLANFIRTAIAAVGAVDEQGQTQTGHQSEQRRIERDLSKIGLDLNAVLRRLNQLDFRLLRVLDQID